MTGSTVLQNMHKPLVSRNARTFCDTFEDAMHLLAGQCAALLRIEERLTVVIRSNLDPSLDRFGFIQQWFALMRHQELDGVQAALLAPDVKASVLHIIHGQRCCL